MSTYSNILAWRIPWTEEPGGLSFIGWQQARHGWVSKSWRHLWKITSQLLLLLKRQHYFQTCEFPNSCHWGRYSKWHTNIFAGSFSLSLFFFFISWRLITSQYFSGFCHTLTWISHGVTCIPHPHPPSHLPLHQIPLGLPSAPGPGTCLMHPTWAGDLSHYRYIHVSMLFSWNIPPSPSPTESKSLFCTSVSLFLFCI